MTYEQDLIKEIRECQNPHDKIMQFLQDLGFNRLITVIKEEGLTFARPGNGKDNSISVTLSEKADNNGRCSLN